MTYLHTKNDNKKSILIYFSTLIPLIIYGIYKNGYLLYLNHYISFLNIFKIVYLVLISLLISILIEYLFTKNISFNYSHLDLVIIALFCPYNISILLYSIIILIYRIIDEVFLNKYNINKIALMHLLLALIMFLLGKYSYLNIAEANNIYLLNLGDIILGRGVGGIGTSSIILGIWMIV